MVLEKLFDEVSTQMTSRLNQARIGIGTHAPSKGTTFENIFIEFLREYLPKFMDVSSGFIVDANGNQSRQLDVILFDANKSPKFYQKENIRVLPIECVYGVIEVKAKLAISDVGEIFENMKSVRRLEKTAYVRPTDNPMNSIITKHTIYDRVWEIWPVHYFVFAFDSVQLENIVSALTGIITKEKLEPWTRIDTVGVLNKGVICNQYKDGNIDALPGNDSTLIPINTSKALLLFYVLISSHLLQAVLPPLRINPYVQAVQWW